MDTQELTPQYFVLSSTFAANFLIECIEHLQGTEVYRKEMRYHGNQFLKELEKYTTKVLPLIWGLDDKIMDHTSRLLNNWYLFPKCQVFLTASKKIVESMSAEFFAAIERGETVLPILKPLGEMTLEHATIFVGAKPGAYTLVRAERVDYDGIYAEVQERGISRMKPKRMVWVMFGEYCPERFLFLCWNGYDVFGWLDKGKAMTIHQAEDEVWRDVSAGISSTQIERGCPFDEPLLGYYSK